MLELTLGPWNRLLTSQPESAHGVTTYIRRWNQEQDPCLGGGGLMRLNGKSKYAKICEKMRKICAIIFCCHKLNEAAPWGFQAFFENV